MSDPVIFRFGRTSDTFIILLEGRGNMHNSPALLQFVEECLESNRCERVVLNLQYCEYLDSTFLGCLVTLHKKFAGGSDSRFAVADSPEVKQRLLAGTRLDRLLEFAADTPTPAEWHEVPSADVAQGQFVRHLIDCHERLAELGGPEASRFEQVAEQLTRELNESPSP